MSLTPPLTLHQYLPVHNTCHSHLHLHSIIAYLPSRRSPTHKKCHSHLHLHSISTYLPSTRVTHTPVIRYFSLSLSSLIVSASPICHLSEALFISHFLSGFSTLVSNWQISSHPRLLRICPHQSSIEESGAGTLQTNMGYWPDVVLMLCHRLRRWPNIKPICGLSSHVCGQAAYFPVSVLPSILFPSALLSRHHLLGLTSGCVAHFHSATTPPPPSTHASAVQRQTAIWCRHVWHINYFEFLAPFGEWYQFFFCQSDLLVTDG